MRYLSADAHKFPSFFPPFFLAVGYISKYYFKTWTKRGTKQIISALTKLVVRYTAGVVVPGIFYCTACWVWCWVWKVSDYDASREVSGWIAVRRIRLRASFKRKTLMMWKWMALSSRLWEGRKESGEKMGVPSSVTSQQDAHPTASVGPYYWLIYSNVPSINTY